MEVEKNMWEWLQVTVMKPQGRKKKKLQKPVPIKIKKIKLTEVKPCIYSGQHDSYSFIILTPLLFIDAWGGCLSHKAQQC